MTKDGVLVIKAERHRTREQNRRDAIERLAALIVEASKAPKYRVKTFPHSHQNREGLKQSRRGGR
jgi:ribosome-associated protein